MTTRRVSDAANALLLLLLSCSGSRAQLAERQPSAALSCSGSRAQLANKRPTAARAAERPGESPRPASVPSDAPSAAPTEPEAIAHADAKDPGKPSAADDAHDGIPGWPALLPAQRCPQFGRGRRRFRLTDPRLPETSGIASGDLHRDWLYAHNDSGDGPRIFAFDWSGVQVELQLGGQQVLDAEDIAVAVDKNNTSWIYLADTGDNLERRHTGVFVLRVPEPKQIPPHEHRLTLSGVQQVHLQFPSGPHDVEAMLVDPLTSNLFLISKGRDGHNHVFRVPAGAFAQGSALAEPVGQLHLGLVTAADITADGRLVAVRTYTDAWLWPREPSQTVAEALMGAACKLPLAIEQQGESFAWARDGSGYYTISEGIGQTLYYYPRLKP